MFKQRTVEDRCEQCESHPEQIYTLNISERVAKMFGNNIYSNYSICTKCETMYVSYDRDYGKHGVKKRYQVEDEDKKELLKKVPYKDWMPIGQPTTEYGMYKKFGKFKLHNPIKGDIYHLIETAIQMGETHHIEKLAIIYPKEVENVRNFTI